ncbi:MAG: hypothetical protein BZY79_06530 [SAR202 cluster bacterium Casp-Chloro-G4]|nr:hypothetical protein [Chloroflexota bacterium]MDA1226830.1 hypothetical protein [Chloroflexota bacterium]PKB60874.1 MAG: hypothetical protein BZY79_06530 [SAR202 cluster bacterium Casp-Chloro-G4]
MHFLRDLVGARLLLRGGLPVLLALMLAFPLVGSNMPSASAQGIDKDRLDTTLLQAYFLSVDNFAGPVMMGGVGIPLVPNMIPPEMFMGMMGQMGQMANFDPANMPANPGLLSAVYASADPRLVPDATVDPMDFGTMRWDPEGFDTTIATRDQAMLIMKFAEWAKFFHKGFNGESILFPSPEMEAFLSLAFTADGMMILQFVGANLMTENGYVTSINMDGGTRQVVDDGVDSFDQAVMLWALSDFMYTIKDTEDYPMLGAFAQQMATPEQMEQLMGMWGQTFELVKANPVTEVKDKGLAIVALTWYAAAMGEQAPMADITQEVENLALGLGNVETTAFEKAASIRGLIEAWRLTGNIKYLNTALDLWDELEALWDEDAQTYATEAGATTYTYTPWDTGLIIGALSEIIVASDNPLVGLVREDIGEQATNRFMDFFDGTIMGSGFVHAPVPTPGRTGLLVSNISYDTSSGNWTVNDSRYSTAGSQYAANEMIWMEGTLQGRLTGYPEITAAPPRTPSVGDVSISNWGLAGLAGIGALLLGAGSLLLARRHTILHS